MNNDILLEIMGWLAGPQFISPKTGPLSGARAQIQARTFPKAQEIVAEMGVLIEVINTLRLVNKQFHDRIEYQLTMINGRLPHMKNGAFNAYKSFCLYVEYILYVNDFSIYANIDLDRKIYEIRDCNKHSRFRFLSVLESKITSLKLHIETTRNPLVFYQNTTLRSIRLVFRGDFAGFGKYSGPPICNWEQLLSLSNITISVDLREWSRISFFDFGAMFEGAATEVYVRFKLMGFPQKKHKLATGNEYNASVATINTLARNFGGASIINIIINNTPHDVKLMLMGMISDFGPLVARAENGEPFPWSWPPTHGHII